MWEARGDIIDSETQPSPWYHRWILFSLSSSGELTWISNRNCCNKKGQERNVGRVGYLTPWARVSLCRFFYLKPLKVTSCKLEMALWWCLKCQNFQDKSNRRVFDALVYLTGAACLQKGCSRVRRYGPLVPEIFCMDRNAHAFRATASCDVLI